MGQSILDGNLPYVELWDLKPPLAFFSYALAILAFGKSIISVRLFGTLCVMSAAILTYYICRSVWSSKLSLLTAIIFIVLTGPLMDGKSVMTEHIAIVPLLGSLALLVSSDKLVNMKFFLVGLLMGSACMIRLNLAYVALIIGLSYIKIVTHPSNISKEYLLRVLQTPTSNTNQELLKVLEQKPEFIVKNENVWYLQDHPEAIALLEATLKTQYTLLNNMGETQIYRQISGVAQ
ncbi:MAG: phospholipid carrier-dependent glycosyltransferase [Nodularia sp. (in: Bacteria)]|nr:MAG: phospholipid carrier-dependent glycosyltransferase [Nodularia sp. (in: cyanobacteria)]